MADVIDPAIKHGGGPEKAKNLLAECSDLVKQMEELELMPAGTDRQKLESIQHRFREFLELMIVSFSKGRSQR